MWASERLVSNASDESEEGTLRVVLQDACNTAGNDTIGFAETRLVEIRIPLGSPLVIPEDCQGSVTLEGSSKVRTILDASDIPGTGSTPGDICILNIYSDNHTVRDFQFTDSSNGAGLCLFGKNNLAEENIFDENRYGVVISDAFQEDYPGMNGNGNELRANTIGPNDAVGVWVEASDVLIGGDSFDEDRNIIQYNEEGGILVVGNDTENVTITHNTVAGNGNGMNLDLNENGVTLNDLSDEDNGPNYLLNFADYFQAFPLVLSPAGEERYWAWGVSMSGTRVELYSISEDDLATGLGYGGGNSHYGDFDLSGMTYSVTPDVVALPTGQVMTTLTFDDEGNTSEYAMNIEVGFDADLDGIVDQYEQGDGTPSSGGSRDDNPDSDSDGLPDSAEDHNRNGIWDQELGETCAYNSDSDRDGLSDWAEVRGDGVYDEGFDTDPLDGDTDADGLADGAEDANQNGVWEGYLGETSPLLTDSDDDGDADNGDNCPVIYNPGQESWYCQS